MSTTARPQKSRAEGANQMSLVGGSRWIFALHGNHLIRMVVRALRGLC